ncbi:MAG: HD domain-containing phosphohydrolase [Desulfobacterales bacterium]|jgi:HD-GYP domain-containing protein (c-di-GMP phosphodiesterase class II)
MESTYSEALATDFQRLSAISSALKTKDQYTEGHARRVALYAMRLARRLRLPSEEIGHIGIGGLMHDVGKIGLSDRIFSNKTEQLAGELLAEVRRHPDIGVSLLEGIDSLSPVLDYVHYHHERMDGSGYPCGLKSDEIPLGARIISVVDCFDAITTDRPYQRRKTCAEAFAILRRMANHELCPDLVEAFVADIEENGMIDEEPAEDHIRLPLRVS